MWHKILFTVLVTALFTGSNKSLAQSLSGYLVDTETNEFIPATHVINTRTYKGTLTNGNGAFSIELQWGDTIVFSNIAYRYFYFVYQDSSSALTDVIIEMEEQNYLLNEVGVYSYQLTTNEEKQIQIMKPSVPGNNQIKDEEIIKASALNPVDLLYNLFGSKPQELMELARLKEEDAYRHKLHENNNRKSVVSLTGLSYEELEAFMFYCKYSPVRMHSLNDYQFLLSVQRCYKQYVKEKEMEDFLNQFD